MINLIPPKGHTALKHEYMLRVGALYGFMLAGVFAASAILMIPTYVLVSSQLNSVRPDDHMEETQEAYKNALGNIQEANIVMAQLRGGMSNIEISTVIKEIVQVAPKGVVFKTFQAARAEGLLKTVDIQGQATTRKTLAALKNALEASPLFESANVPISDLARENNLPFVVTITLAEKSMIE